MIYKFTLYPITKKYSYIFICATDQGKLFTLTECTIICYFSEFNIFFHKVLFKNILMRTKTVQQNK